MAVIGRGAAVAAIGRLEFDGHLAWLAWLFVHIMYLVGFQNRILVLLQWAWNYLTWHRGARLITAPVGANVVSAPQTTDCAPDAARQPLPTAEDGSSAGAQSMAAARLSRPT
jgi:NADH dehydrogenase